MNGVTHGQRVVETLVDSEGQTVHCGCLKGTVVRLGAINDSLNVPLDESGRDTRFVEVVGAANEVVDALCTNTCQRQRPRGQRTYS